MNPINLESMLIPLCEFNTDTKTNFCVIHILAIELPITYIHWNNIFNIWN